MRKYYIVISSNRPANQIVEHMNNLDLGVKFEVFNKDLQENMYWNKDNVIGVTNEKAVGILYIDDRGYRYRDLESLQKFMEEKMITIKEYKESMEEVKKEKNKN